MFSVSCYHGYFDKIYYYRLNTWFVFLFKTFTLLSEVFLFNLENIDNGIDPKKMPQSHSLIKQAQLPSVVRGIKFATMVYPCPFCQR